MRAAVKLAKRATPTNLEEIVAEINYLPVMAVRMMLGEIRQRNVELANQIVKRHAESVQH